MTRLRFKFLHYYFVSKGFVSSKIHDKCDCFDLKIDNFLIWMVTLCVSHLIAFTFLSLFDLLKYRVLTARNRNLTAKLVNKTYRDHKLRKPFCMFYRRHYELVCKFNVGLKTLLATRHTGTLGKSKGDTNFLEQLRKMVLC